MPRIRQDPGACVCMCAASRDLRLLWKCDVVYGLEANRGQEDCRCGKERPGFRARMVLFVKKRLYEMTAIQMSTRALLIAADMFMFSVQMLVCCSFLSSQFLVAFNFWWDLSVFGWCCDLFCTSHLLNLHVNLSLCILVFYVESYFIVKFIFCLNYSSLQISWFCIA